ncbi:MAG: SLOG family protein [Chlorobiales bacterium]
MSARALLHSRSFTNYDALEREVSRILSEKCLTPTVIVSGGAKGADALAEEFVNRHALALEIHKPVWTHKGAGKERNKRIVENADFMIAFWDFKSGGAKHTISLWRKTLKPFEVVNTNNL